MPTKDALFARGYEPGDEHAILEMFNAIFNQNRDLDHWYWKYRDSPLGPGAISLAVTRDGRLAAHFGGYPVHMTSHPEGGMVEGFITYQLGDKMSRPEFRNAGFRSKSPLGMAFNHFRDKHASECPFGYGFVTGHSRRLGLLLFNYMDVEKIPFRSLKLKRSAFSWQQRVMSFFQRFSVEEVHRIGEEYTDFFYRAAKHYSCLVTKSADYLEWRYMRRPDKKYLILALRYRSKLVGWAVFSRTGSVVEWVDSLFAHDCAEHVDYILDFLSGHDLAVEADFVHCWFPSRPVWWDNTLKRIGFESMPEPNDLHLSGPVFNRGDAEIFLQKNLYYTMGDSDLY